MAVLTIILLVLALILLLPVGADACVNNSGGYIKIKAGPVSFRLPQFSDKIKKSKTKKDRKTKADNEAEIGKKKRHKSPTVKDLFPIIKMGLHALGRFRRRLCVDLLEVNLICGGSDPYNTAISYGYISAAAGALLPFADRAFKIREKKINIDVDFDSGCFVYYARLILTIQVWEVISIAFAFLYEFTAYKIKRRKENRRHERNDNDGESDQRTYERNNDKSQKHGGCKYDCRRTDNIA